MPLGWGCACRADAGPDGAPLPLFPVPGNAEAEEELERQHSSGRSGKLPRGRVVCRRVGQQLLPASC